MDETKKTGIGSMIGTIIIVALIVLGGLYFWGKRLEESKNLQQMTADTQQITQNLTPEQMEANAIKSTNPSDDLDAIEADLNNTNLDNMAPELQ